MMKKEKRIMFTFQEVVVIRFCLKIFQQTDFSSLAPEIEIKKAKNVAGEIYEMLTKVEHNLSFYQLCVIGGAVDNFVDLVTRGQKFDLPENKLNGYVLLLTSIQQKIKKLVAN